MSRPINACGMTFIGAIGATGRWRAQAFAIAFGVLAMSARASAGIAAQGKNAQGTSIQAAVGAGWLQGARLIGAREDHTVIEIEQFAGHAVVARAGGRAALTQLAPRDLIGAAWTESRCTSDGCTSLMFRIADVAVDRSVNTMPDHSSNSDVWLYRVEYAEPRESGLSPWLNVCERAGGDTDMGLFVNGRWGSDGSWRRDGYTFSCPRGVVAKCARSWGYKPWKAVEIPGRGMVDLRPLHVACTRAARADYCGDGRSYTADGVTIDLFDVHGLNVRESPAGFTEEAGFDASGAVYLRHVRVPWSQRAKRGAAPVACRSSARSHDAALIHVWSEPSARWRSAH